MQSGGQGGGPTCSTTPRHRKRLTARGWSCIVQVEAVPADLALGLLPGAQTVGQSLRARGGTSPPSAEVDVVELNTISRARAAPGL